MTMFSVPPRRAALITAMLATLLAGLAGSQGVRPTALPADHAHLKAAPTTVTLTFPATVDSRAATFKVYRFPLSSMMAGRRPMTGVQMDVFAAAQARRMLSLTTDTADRMDTGVIGKLSSPNRVVIGLKPNLTPGVYVTAWRVTGPGQPPKTGFVHFHSATF
ncbi:copper resistance protein CopC [Deinococcus sp.]|uniref:copper resistance protein CopC n=1 Tax=Deinococcus sp. TaxID=47478 RepID=UPI003CC548B1